MSTMSQEKNSTGFVPRKGQQDLIEWLPQNIQTGGHVSIQWPTGYGKSIGFAAVWKEAFARNICNRFLLVVANDAQRDQAINDFAGDCELVGAPCDGGIWSFRREARDIKVAMAGSCPVMVTTVQQLHASIRGGGLNTMSELLGLSGTRWFVGFDEYHHYGEGMEWGEAAKGAVSLASYTAAMSATPWRRGADTMFTKPDLVVTYSEAVEEGALKPMLCHSYEYKVTAIVDGEPVEYLSSELVNLAADVGGLDKWEERKSIRYSAQYIHPMIIHPVDRLRTHRVSFPWYQMLVRAMSCNHAKTVCEQIKSLAPDLRCDWVGTGPFGRTDNENAEIRRKFCPPKNRDGIRPKPELDVLVNVSMAGEGFDSVYVSEIVDLFPVSIKAKDFRATQDRQFYGRASRAIRQAPGARATVSVPTDHPLAIFAGGYLHEWMDTPGKELSAPKKREPVEDGEWCDFPPLPEKRVVSLECVNRETGAWKRVKEDQYPETSYEDMSPAQREHIDNLVRGGLESIAKKESDQMRMDQILQGLDAMVGRLAYHLAKNGAEVNRADIGRHKKSINSDLLRRFGPRESLTMDQAESAYEYARGWLRQAGRRAA